jgi:hypothetical protein
MLEDTIPSNSEMSSFACCGCIPTKLYTILLTSLSPKSLNAFDEVAESTVTEHAFIRIPFKVARIDGKKLSYSVSVR